MNCSISGLRGAATGAENKRVLGRTVTCVSYRSRAMEPSANFYPGESECGHPMRLCLSKNGKKTQ